MPSRAVHTRIVAQTGMQLVVADIDTDDMPSATLQQAVGKATGGLANVETILPTLRPVVASAPASFRPPRKRSGSLSSSVTAGTASAGNSSDGLAMALPPSKDTTFADQPLCLRARRGEHGWTSRASARNRP